MCYSGKCPYEMYSGDCDISSRRQRSCPPQVHKFEKPDAFVLLIGNDEDTKTYEFKTKEEAEDFLQGFQLAYKLQYGGRGVKINGEYNKPRRATDKGQSWCIEEIS